VNLHAELLRLAQQFRRRADELDSIYSQTADPRALQAGARCELAAAWRGYSARLFQIATEMQWHYPD
jgi:uncharacterized protein YukE